MTSIRWAFNARAWKPTQAEWLLASQSVQPEEKARIGQFYFQRDAKSSMIGRCLLRKVISESLDIPWNSFTMTRTDKGKPVLQDQSLAGSLCFNVAHQGDYVVLAAERHMACGVDVMEVRAPGSRSIPDYFDLMKRKLTANEWRTIKSSGTEQQQLAMFYRHWCLKESYIKAIGIGLGFELTRIDFHVNTRRLAIGEMVSDTALYLDGTLVTPHEWIFHETRLDENHYVAVGLQKLSADEHVKEVPFETLTFLELMESAQSLLPTDIDYWNLFSAKPEMPNFPGQKSSR